MPHLDATPRPVNVPTPGYYRMRWVNRAPWVPARIMEQDGYWLVLIDGERTSEVAGREPWRVPMMERVAFSNAIDQAEYEALLAQRRALPEGHPLKDARKPVDWRSAPSAYRRT